MLMHGNVFDRKFGLSGSVILYRLRPMIFFYLLIIYIFNAMHSHAGEHGNEYSLYIFILSRLWHAVSIYRGPVD